MTKAESRKAAKEGWRVRDDFYAIGTVVGERGRPVKGKPKAYRSIFYRGGDRVHLGYFHTAEEAHEAYKKMSLAIDGEFSVFT